MYHREKEMREKIEKSMVSQSHIAANKIKQVES